MKIYAKKSQGNWKKVYGQTVSPRILEKQREKETDGASFPLVD